MVKVVDVQIFCQLILRLVVSCVFNHRPLNHRLLLVPKVVLQIHNFRLLLFLLVKPFEKLGLLILLLRAFLSELVQISESSVLTLHVFLNISELLNQLLRKLKHLIIVGEVSQSIIRRHVIEAKAARHLCRSHFAVQVVKFALVFFQVL